MQSKTSNLQHCFIYKKAVLFYSTGNAYYKYDFIRKVSSEFDSINAIAKIIHFPAVNAPPSTDNKIPVRNDDASLVKNSMAFDVSDTSPTRPTGYIFL